MVAVVRTCPECRQSFRSRGFWNLRRHVVRAHKKRLVGDTAVFVSAVASADSAVEVD